MSTPTQEELKKPSIELILYRLGEMKGVIDTVNNKVDNYQKETNDKIQRIQVDLAVATALQRKEDEDERDKPRFDIQKIVLAAFGVISSVTALAFWLAQHK